jgi:hypothetical protein
VPSRLLPWPKGTTGDSALVGEAQDLHDLIAALREDHGVRRIRSVVGKEGPAVTFELFPTGEDLVFR